MTKKQWEAKERRQEQSARQVVKVMLGIPLLFVIMALFWGLAFEVLGWLGLATIQR